jgi:hypothetical protein
MMANDNPFWCEKCDVNALALDDMFDRGVYSIWPAVTWCPVCGRIQHEESLEFPIMTKDIAPTREQRDIAIKRGMEADAEFFGLRPGEE